MTYSIKHLFHINASRQSVFEAISTIKGLSNWWTTETSGDCSVNGTIQFRFADSGGPDMKVTDCKPAEYLSWECIESNHGWKGYTFSFTLEDKNGKTRVIFSHDGWKEQDENYAACSFSWGRYMESLRRLCETGRGEAFGSEAYKK